MPVFQLRKDEISFPDPKLGEADGLLAFGGDLSVERLLLAYTNGIFPWFNPGEEILWWCPKERFLMLNRDFKDTMHRCRMLREKEGTWIGDEMEEAYLALHKRGFAVSVEAYEDKELAGGFYGVSIGRCFFGESMFSEKENGSKAALIAFSQIFARQNISFIDCQFHTEHLESMGGRFVSWEDYHKLLREGIMPPSRCKPI